MTTRYDTDFYAWTQEQGRLLEARQFDALDIANLAEEITSLGASDRRALISQLTRLVMHLLKWRYQPDGRQEGHSWEDSILNARDEIALILDASPSLRREVPTLLTTHYHAARRRARADTCLPLATVPATCPWAPEEVLDADFWPEEAP
jgi:hypothetical protein